MKLYTIDGLLNAATDASGRVWVRRWRKKRGTWRLVWEPARKNAA